MLIYLVGRWVKYQYFLAMMTIISLFDSMKFGIFIFAHAVLPWIIFKIHRCLLFLSVALSVSSFHVRRNPRLYSRTFASSTLIPGVCNGYKSLRYMVFISRIPAHARCTSRMNDILSPLRIKLHLNSHSHQRNSLSQLNHL